MPSLYHASTFVVGLLLASTGAGNAEVLRGAADKEEVTDIYTNPKVNGARVDWCYGYDFRMGPGTDNPAAFLGCGQDAADAYCRLRGYEKASVGREGGRE
ncbi:hypothetical protein Naga_101597g1 [Nannochloropsis gaditana]|uniref:Uncharacterized protein n=1 Tax=Nannochloropsis gaditana TaxID=72520 RepID=W7TI19_9STRA|nr:hypothetical protein Naga_101597g1 [Nannochloropsis gaditana]